MAAISKEAATRLRIMLSTIQVRAYCSEDIPMEARERIINEISAEGFELIDELEGVIR